MGRRAGRAFHEHKHCSRCGADLEVQAWLQAEAERTGHTCPRCPGEELFGHQIDGFLLQECARCCGTFIDAATFDRLIEARRKSPATQALGIRRNAGQTLRLDSSDLYVKCPMCLTVMNRSNFARSSGIVVHVCLRHGTWFDVDELPRVVAFVQNGGMDQAEQRESEERRQQARMAEREARAAQLRAAEGEPDQAPGVGGLLIDATLAIGGWLRRGYQWWTLR